MASVLSVHAMFTSPAEHIMCWTSVQAWFTVPVCILLPLSEAVFSLGFHGRQCVLWASNVPFVVWSKNMCLLSALCHLVTHQVFHMGGFDGGKRDIYFRIIQCELFWQSCDFLGVGSRDKLPAWVKAPSHFILVYKMSAGDNCTCCVLYAGIKFVYLAGAALMLVMKDDLDWWTMRGLQNRN